MKYYFVYKTTNLISGKYYIGAHSTENINDRYLGSGKVLKRAIRKYGRNNFSREILYFCDSIEDLYIKEVEIINEHIDNDMCYNQKNGGIGGWEYVNSVINNTGTNNIMNRDHDAKHRCIANAKVTRSKNKEYYYAIAIKNLEKAVGINTGSVRPKQSEFARTHMSNLWSGNYDKMRDSLSSKFKVISPLGEEFVTNRLQEFCDERNLGYVALWNSSRTNKIVKKGRSKGWICTKILD